MKRKELLDIIEPYCYEAGDASPDGIWYANNLDADGITLVPFLENEDEELNITSYCEIFYALKLHDYVPNKYKDEFEAYVVYREKQIPADYAQIKA